MSIASAHATRLRIECRAVSNVDRDVPPGPPTQPQPTQPTPTQPLPTQPQPAQPLPVTPTPPPRPLAYQPYPRAGGAVIDIEPAGNKVFIRITYHHDRAWPLVIGFGLMAAAATAKIGYDGLTGGRAALTGDGGIIIAAVLFALLALAASVRGGTPPLQLMANPRELRMQGGVLNETLAWRRDEILSITAEDIEQPHTNNRRTSVVVELRDEEYVVFPVATREEQAAIVQALRGALKLPPEQSEARG